MADTAYPVLIDPKVFRDGRGMLGSYRGHSRNKPLMGTQSCPLAEPEQTPPEEKPPASLTELTLKAGARTSKSYSDAAHEPIPPEAEERVFFCPKSEKVALAWKLENPDSATGGKIEVFRRDASRPIFSLKLDAGALAGGTYEWDGSTDPSQTATFPGKFITVEHSPYKVKMTIEGQVAEKKGEAWSYCEVLVHSIAVAWGDWAKVPKDRADIDPANKERILGKESENKKGLEQECFEALVAANATPAKDQEHKVILKSNLFSIKPDPSAMVTEDMLDDTDFQEYKKLWGDGPRIPLVAKVKIKTSAGEGTDDVPEALGATKLLWDWQDKKADRWNEFCDAKATPATKGFLEEAHKKAGTAKPAESCNCPASYGGKYGDPSKPVFPAIDRDFPNKVEVCSRRNWASLSSFPTAAPSNPEKCASTVIFQPSRMAGDRYVVTVQIFFDKSLDGEQDLTLPEPVQGQFGNFKVFRKVDLYYLVYGTPDLGCDANQALEDTKKQMEKECCVLLEVKKEPITKPEWDQVYKDTLTEILNTAKIVKDIGPVNPIQMKTLFKTDVPEGSPPVVYNDVPEHLRLAEEIFKNGRSYRIEGATSVGNYLTENLVGKTSGTKGVRLYVGNTNAGAKIDVLVEDPAKKFSPSEEIEGETSKHTSRGTIPESYSFWGVTYEIVKSSDKRYEKVINVAIEGKAAFDVTYAKSVFSGVALELTDQEKLKIFNVVKTCDQANELKIKITCKDKDSAHANTRLQNLKNYIESIAMDRKELFESNKRNYYLTKEVRDYTDPSLKKDLPMRIIPRIARRLVDTKYAGKEGIFLCHYPGKTNMNELDSIKNSPKPHQEPNLVGAMFGEQSTRTQGIVYLASLPPGPTVSSSPSKKIAAIFSHEIAHAMFLPHSPKRTGNAPGGEAEDKHVKGDTCNMNYDLDSEEFCGLCKIRMRGWKTEAADARLTQAKYDYKVELAIGDVEELFVHSVGSMRGKMERLQVMGLFARPLDHPEAPDCFTFAWNHAKELYPELAAADIPKLKEFFQREIPKFLVDGGVLPAAGEFKQIRVPTFHVLYPLNLLEAMIPEADQGKPVAKPYESFILGADPIKVREAYLKANPALGKIPLKATVKYREKGSTKGWDTCDEASGVTVYFQLVKPDDVTTAPEGAASVDVAGAKGYYTKVTAPALKGATQTYVTANIKDRRDTNDPQVKNADSAVGGCTAEQVLRKPKTDGFNAIEIGKNAPHEHGGWVAANGAGVANIVLQPSWIGGDAYKLRVYVGPPTQDKDPATAADDVVTTGTMVLWRAVRICRYIAMKNSDNEGALPAYVKPNGALYCEKYKDYVGAIPPLDLKDALAKEFAKSYTQLLLEPKAETVEDLKTHEAQIRTEITHLLTHYPKFNMTSVVKGAHNSQLGVSWEKMTVESNRTVFTITLSGKPELGTLTVRPIKKNVNTQTMEIKEELSDKSTAVLTDEGCQDTDNGRATGRANITAKTIDYVNRTVRIQFAEQQPQDFHVVYHIKDFIDVDKFLVAPFPDNSPFLFNLRLPTDYNAQAGAGYWKIGVTPEGKLAPSGNSKNKHLSFIQMSTLGLGTGLLMTAYSRGFGGSRGFFPGLCLVQGAYMDNYNLLEDNPGTQEGKAVGNAVFVFGGNGQDPAQYARLVVHELSHALYMQHAPGSPTAGGAKANLHDPADVCVMSYDDRNDGDHCGKCVANLRGMKVNGLP